MYVVFLGPFKELKEAYQQLVEYKKENKTAYVVEVSHSDVRMTLLDKFDYRVNDDRQILIIAYANEESLNEYYESGGEDWMWFNDDINTYLRDNHSKDNIFYIIGVPHWLEAEDMEVLAEELGNTEKYFGYYVINGEDKLFIQHAPPFDVISQISDFLNIEMSY